MANIDALKYFRMEAQEHLEGLNSGLLQLEAEPADKATLQTLFRLAHTLKGSARMVSLNDVGAVAHKMEDVLGALRDDDDAYATETVISAMLEAIHTIEQMMAELDRDGEIDTAPVIGRLQQAIDDAKHGDRPDAGAPVDAPADGTAAPPLPESELTEPGLFSGIEPDKGSGVPTESSIVRVALGKVDKLANLAGELVINKIRLTDQNTRLHALSNDMQRAIRSLNEVQQWARSKDVQQLLQGTPQGKALNSVLARSRTIALREGLNGLVSDAKSQAAQLDNVVSSLHDGIMDLRMLPASTLTTPLKLVLRQASLYLKKPARLEVRGEGIEIDKALLEGIREPLAHLIRNAVDHGLEPPHVRTAQGKAGEGRIRLIFERHGATLAVTVQDDGTGIDVERIRDKALERGLLDAADADALRPADMLRCLTTPGFSTAGEVTEISGRGVGLDVVASAVKALKGSMELSSAPDEGTSIYMRFPVNHVDHGRVPVPGGTEGLCRAAGIGVAGAPPQRHGGGHLRPAAGVEGG